MATFGSFALVLELVSVAVGYSEDVEIQRVIGSAGSGIVHRDSAVNAMPLADEDQVDAFMDDGRAVFHNNDSVLVIGDAPAFSEGGYCEESQASGKS